MHMCTDFWVGRGCWEWECDPVYFKEGFAVLKFGICVFELLFERRKGAIRSAQGEAPNERKDVHALSVQTFLMPVIMVSISCPCHPWDVKPSICCMYPLCRRSWFHSLGTSICPQCSLRSFAPWSKKHQTRKQALLASHQSCHLSYALSRFQHQKKTDLLLVLVLVMLMLMLMLMPVLVLMLVVSRQSYYLSYAL